MPETLRGIGSVGPETALVDWGKQPPALAALRRMELRHERRIAIMKLTGSALVVATSVTLAVVSLVHGFRSGGGALVILTAWGLRWLIRNAGVVRSMRLQLATLERHALPEARVVIRE